jgi:hypothetical protein
VHSKGLKFNHNGRFKHALSNPCIVCLDIFYFYDSSQDAMWFLAPRYVTCNSANRLRNFTSPRRCDIRYFHGDEDSNHCLLGSDAEDLTFVMDSVSYYKALACYYSRWCSLLSPVYPYYTSTPQYVFMAWCSVKEHRDNFTFISQQNCETEFKQEDSAKVLLGVVVRSLTTPFWCLGNSIN